MFIEAVIQRTDTNVFSTVTAWDCAKIGVVPEHEYLAKNCDWM